ncbi:CoA transferase [Pseudooceanicola sp.]|uniref:CoA transferase n=1 Tax=Pseudooceanicola sp. TaxID=1914328 RepID=UPI0040595B0E
MTPTAGTLSYWEAELGNVRVPCAPIDDVPEILAHSHTKQSDIILSYEESGGGTLRGVAQPFRFSGRRLSTELPPPYLGEDSKKLLQGLGIGEAEIRDPMMRGVVN